MNAPELCSIRPLPVLFVFRTEYQLATAVVQKDGIARVSLLRIRIRNAFYRRHTKIHLKK